MFLSDLSRLIDGEDARLAALECGDFADREVSTRDAQGAEGVLP